MKTLAFCAAMGMLACGGTTSQSKPPLAGSAPGKTSAIEIATLDEAREAIGKLVRVTGTPERGFKLGDVYLLSGAERVYCIGYRVDQSAPNEQVTVEGVLLYTHAFESREYAGGSWSQGLSPGGPAVYALRDCVRR